MDDSGALEEKRTHPRHASHGVRSDDDVGPPPVVDPGVPGASARREYERRRARREERIRAEHPRPSGLAHTLDEVPASTLAWEDGVSGEEKLGARLDERASEALRLLHDRRVPGGVANIDHLAVTPSGVHVIDAKRYQGRRPRLVVDGGWLRPRTERLLVGGRDRTRLVDGMHEQIALVRGVVGEAVPVHGVLCFVDGDWPLIGGAFTIRGVSVLWPRRLHHRLAQPGPLDARALDDVHRRLAAALTPA